MPFAIVHSPSPKYVSASDILIGDMSDINYEFLLLKRPLILLANKWVIKEWPDIGIKTSLAGLNAAISRSISYSNEYDESRRFWLKKTIYDPYGNSSERILSDVIRVSKFKNPTLVFIDGNSEVRWSNLMPLYEEARSKKLKCIHQHYPREVRLSSEVIYFGVHFEDLLIKSGFKVHLDHGLKGKGAANIQVSINDYKKHNYFPLIDLHVTAGKVGDDRTKMQLGPNCNRTLIGGYPKASSIIALNTVANRTNVCEELGFNPDFPIVTYAPAGPESYEKPGGSLSTEVFNELERIGENYNYNVLIKLKNTKKSLLSRTLGYVKKNINKFYLNNTF